ncbi:unnamed protein product, partial [Prorocentrum cordatum]
GLGPTVHCWRPGPDRPGDRARADGGRGRPAWHAGRRARGAPLHRQAASVRPRAAGRAGPRRAARGRPAEPRRGRRTAHPDTLGGAPGLRRRPGRAGRGGRRGRRGRRRRGGAPGAGARGALAPAAARAVLRGAGGLPGGPRGRAGRPRRGAAAGGHRPAGEVLPLLEAAFGEDLTVELGASGREGRVSACVWRGEEGGVERELRVTLTVCQDGAWTALAAGGAAEILQADGGATTSDELVLNAIFSAWHQLGRVSVWDAFDIARQTFCSGPAAGAPEAAGRSRAAGLWLDSRSGAWFEWRPEGSAMELAFFTLGEVAERATAPPCLRGHLRGHGGFELAGEPQAVLSPELAARFAEKLAGLRLSAAGHRLRSPGLVFHASPSRDALDSILRRGFLLPGDWVEGTPSYQRESHGSRSGVGVYCSPDLDLADCYGGESSEGLAIVALAAFGVCWEPRDRFDEKMEQSRLQWQRLQWFSSSFRTGEVQGGWRKEGRFWAAAGEEQDPRAERLLAHAPDASGLYDGAFHSRWCKNGSHTEIVLASPEQLLPVLLVPYRRRGAQPPSGRELGCMPEQRLECVALRGAPGSDPSALALEEDSEWAIFVDWAAHQGPGYGLGGGADPRAPSVRLCFLLDEAVRSSAFGGLLPSLVQGLSGAVQPAEAAAVWFDAARGVDVGRSVPFSTPEALGAALEEARSARLRAEGAAACGGTGLAQAVRFATDGALRKLSRETERYLASMAEPWHRLQSGDDLVSVRCERPARARVISVERDVFRITGITVGWALHGGQVRVQRAARVEAQDAAELRVAWEDGGMTCFAAAGVRGLRRCRARDVAAETQFLFVVVSGLGPAHMGGPALEALACCVGSCRSQLHGSGARCAWVPVVLGGGAASERLGAYLKAQLSTGTGASGGGGAWWEPVHRCEQPEDLPRVLGVLQEDLLAWSEDGARMGANVSLDQRFVVHGRGFVVDPMEPPRWEVRVRRPRPELESANFMRGTCLIFKGPPPRTLTVDGVAFGVSLVPQRGQAAPARTSAALELGFALEKLAQKLRVAVLGCSEGPLTLGAAAGAAPTRQRLEEWSARLRRWAARLDCLELPPEPAEATATAKAAGASSRREPERAGLPLLWSLPPAQRASYVRRRRGVAHSVQRTTGLAEDALRLQAASEEEPGAAAWLRRVSQMRFGRGILRRAGDAEARTPEAESLEGLRAALGSLQAAAGSSPGAAAWLVSTASGLSARDHAAQAGVALDAGLQDLQSAVYAVGMVGVQIRCVRTEASNVEPWLLIVEHVSHSLADTASAACGLDIGQPLKDEEGAEAPDVAVLLPQGSECALSWFTDSPVYQAYLAVVFARNPVCSLPSQRCALPVLVWVKSAEQMLEESVMASSGPPKSAVGAVGAAWRVHLAAANTVARLAQEGAWCRLARGLAGAADPARLLTEANGGPQSVCEALAALCFAPAAGALWQGAGEAGLRSPQLGRLALALLAEAVSRGCRKLCRSRAPGHAGGGGRSVEQQMLWDALGITDDSVIQPGAGQGGKVGEDCHSDAFDLQRALRRSALFFSPEGKYFAMGRTNCSPQGVVGSLLLRLAAGALGPTVGAAAGPEAAAAVAGRLWRREVSMRAFIEAVLPGTDPPLVQAALYAQGLRYHSARDRAGGVTPLSQPERILRELAREQRRAAHTRALVEQLAAQRAGRRKDARSAQRRARLLEFCAVHRGLPRLFSLAEVEELNAGRPPGDQLELLPTGLLKHHCCFPACPQYLADLRTDKDSDRREEAAAAGGGPGQAAGRRGLFRHLAPMSWPEAAGEDRYVPLVHAVGAVCAQRAEGAEEFGRALLLQLRQQLHGRPGAASCREAWLEELLAGGLLSDLRRAAGAG